MDKVIKVALYSGGLDSFCLAHKVKPDILLYYNVGLPENKPEMAAICALMDINGLPAPVTFDDRYHLAPYKLQNEVMPFRNLLFIAGAFTYGSIVYLGKTASSTNLDKDTTFAEKALDVLKYVSSDPRKNPPHLREHDMRIEMPFDKKTKSQFVAEFIADGGNVDHLLKTRSCYKPYGKECGECVSCVRKSIALVNNGLYTQSMFEQDPALLYPAYLKEVRSRMWTGSGPKSADGRLLTPRYMDVETEIMRAIDKRFIVSPLTQE